MSEKEFPFDIEYQKKLIRVLMSAEQADNQVLHHLEPSFFETAELRWMLSTIKDYEAARNATMTWTALKHEARKLPPEYGPTTLAQLESIEKMDVLDGDWLRDNVLEWIRNRFFLQNMRLVESALKKKDLSGAQEIVKKYQQSVEQITWEPDNLSFFGEDFEKRQKRRLEDKVAPNRVIPTGIDGLDDLLDGGIAKQEFGVFLGYSKSGKSIFLMNVAANAALNHNIQVYHANYEVNQKTLEDRYESWLTGEPFTKLAATKLLTEEGVERARRLNEAMGKRLVLKGSDRFSSTDPLHKTVKGIARDLQKLEKNYAWRPDLIIVDYADLLRSPNKHESAYHEANEVFRDLHDLALEGYAILTVSQANERNVDRNEEHLLYSSQVTQTQEKFRVADFYGSINMSYPNAEGKQERWFKDGDPLEDFMGEYTDEYGYKCHYGYAGILLENSRSHARSGVVPVRTDLSHMRFGIGVLKDVEEKPFLDPSKKKVKK